MEALNKAIDWFGSQTKMAEELGVVPMAVSHWKNRGVPIKHAIRIEKLTGGEVSASSLCPDVFEDGGSVAA